MPVTTLKLPQELKSKIKPLAKRSDKTPHAWMIDALRREIELSEARESFIDDATQAADGIDSGEPVFSMEDVHAFVRARVAGIQARRPPPFRSGKSRRR